MPATRRKGPVWVKERDRGVTLWGRARPMMEGERAPLRDHAKRVGNRRKPASVCRDGHLTRKSKSKSKITMLNKAEIAAHSLCLRRPLCGAARAVF